MFLFTFTEPTLKALLNELHSVRVNWYNIGLELGIPYTELNCFRKMYSDPSDSLRKVLIHWLKTAVDPPPTWEAVVTALRSPLINEMKVAAQLESKYCAPMQDIMDTSNSPIMKAEKSKGTLSFYDLGVTFTLQPCFFFFDTSYRVHLLITQMLSKLVNPRLLSGKI